MFESKWLVVAGVEMAVLLLVLCVALLFYVRRLRHLVTALEDKVTSLRDTVKSVRGEAASARLELAELQRPDTSASDYGRCLDGQIAATRDYFRSLDPDHDRELVEEVDANPERRMVSLRHAFLNIERESWRAEDACIDWTLYQSKLGRIIRLYDPPILTVVDTAGEGEEGSGALRFQALYLEAARKWREVGSEARLHHADLLQQGLALGGGDEFAALLERYANLWNRLGEELEATGGAEERDLDAGHAALVDQQEVLRLRSKAIDQHRLIVALRQQLDGAQSAEQKEALIVELRDQLERHQHFLHEYDLCSRQLEGELERLLEENQTLRRELEQTAEQPVEPDQDVEQLKRLVDEFTRQSCDMLSAVETLEKENARLRTQLQGVNLDSSQVDQNIG